MPLHFPCLWFFVLVCRLVFTSCFEDNSKNIVLIKIFDLKKTPTKDVLVSFNAELNETSQSRYQNLTSKTLNHSSDKVLSQGETIEISEAPNKTFETAQNQREPSNTSQSENISPQISETPGKTLEKSQSEVFEASRNQSSKLSQGQTSTSGISSQNSKSMVEISQFSDDTFKISHSQNKEFQNQSYSVVLNPNEILKQTENEKRELDVLENASLTPVLSEISETSPVQSPTNGMLGAENLTNTETVERALNLTEQQSGTPEGTPTTPPHANTLIPTVDENDQLTRQLFPILEDLPENEDSDEFSLQKRLEDTMSDPMSRLGDIAATEQDLGSLLEIKGSVPKVRRHKAVYKQEGHINVPSSPATSTNRNTPVTAPIHTPGVEPIDASSPDVFTNRSMATVPPNSVLTRAMSSSTLNSTAGLEPSGTVTSYLPRLSGNPSEMEFTECTGLIIKQDFVITAASCVHRMADDTPNTSHASILYHIRIQIILFDGTVGYASRSYQWNQVTLLQIEYENKPPNQYHLFWPQKMIPLGASIPSECRVEGFVYKGSKGRDQRPEYTITNFGRNSIYKHCPSGESDVGTALLQNYENVMCAYHMNGIGPQVSLCGYLPGATLFCPELQGLLYTIYSRSLEDDGTILVGGRSGSWKHKENYQDDTMSVAQEILAQYNLSDQSHLNHSVTNKIRYQSLTDRLNALMTAGDRANQSTTEKTLLSQFHTEKNRSSQSHTEKNRSNKRLSRSVSKLYCSTDKEVALFVDTRFNVEWIRTTVRTNTMFKNEAMRSSNAVAHFVMISLTTLFAVIHN